MIVCSLNTFCLLECASCVVHAWCTGRVPDVPSTEHDEQIVQLAAVADAASEVTNAVLVRFDLLPLIICRVSGLPRAEHVFPIKTTLILPFLENAQKKNNKKTRCSSLFPPRIPGTDLCSTR